jgi:hypothetical protein
VLPPKPKPPGSSPNLLTADALVDRILNDYEAAKRRGIDIPNLVPGPSVSDAQVSVAPLRISADPDAKNNHPSAVTDGIKTINGTVDADTADDTDELDVFYGPLTGHEWIALSRFVDVRDSQDHKPGEPQYCPAFLRLVEFFHVPVARWTDRIMVGNAMEPCLLREDGTGHAEGVE